MNYHNFFWMMLTGLCFCVLTSCTSNADKKEAAPKAVISEELHQAHCDLLAKANEKLAAINQKVRDLNDKIQKGGKLNDTQNAALDEFEVRQSSINKRMHEIKNVPQEEWEPFKATFEKDLEEVDSLINKVLEDF